MASGRIAGLRVACLVLLALAVACEAWLPVQHALPPAGSYDAAVYQVRFGDTTEPVRGAAVSAAFFDEPGLRPMLGRLFVEPEYATSPFRVALIGHALWVERFGSDPGVIGREIEVNDTRVVVIGVLPAGFAFPDNAGLWLPRVGVSRAVWMVRADTADSEFRGLARQAVDDVGRALEAVRPFPRPVTIRLERCGDAAEAVWQEDAGEMLLCDERLARAEALDCLAGGGARSPESGCRAALHDARARWRPVLR